jgi:hypothetical protein
MGSAGSVTLRCLSRSGRVPQSAPRCRSCTGGLRFAPTVRGGAAHDHLGRIAQIRQHDRPRRGLTPCAPACRRRRRASRPPTGYASPPPAPRGVDSVHTDPAQLFGRRRDHRLLPHSRPCDVRGSKIAQLPYNPDIDADEKPLPRRRDAGARMYRWIYWSGVTLFVVWTVFSAYSAFSGL